jgi:hypothetical protein
MISALTRTRPSHVTEANVILRRNNVEIANGKQVRPGVGSRPPQLSHDSQNSSLNTETNPHQLIRTRLRTVNNPQRRFSRLILRIWKVIRQAV